MSRLTPLCWSLQIGLTIEMLFPPSSTMMALWASSKIVPPLPVSSRSLPGAMPDEFEIVAEGISLSSSLTVGLEEVGGVTATIATPTRATNEPYPMELFKNRGAPSVSLLSKHAVRCSRRMLDVYTVHCGRLSVTPSMCVA